MVKQVLPHVSIPRTCFRCGGAFGANGQERVCPACRTKPTSRRVEQKALSVRQQQLAELVRQGKANKIIAYELCLTEGSIKTYLARLFRKVQVNNRTELAIWAERRLKDAALNGTVRNHLPGNAPRA